MNVYSWFLRLDSPVKTVFIVPKDKPASKRLMDTMSCKNKHCKSCVNIPDPLHPNPPPHPHTPPPRSPKIKIINIFFLQTARCKHFISIKNEKARLDFKHIQIKKYRWPGSEIYLHQRTKCEERNDLLMTQNIQVRWWSTVEGVSWIGFALLPPERVHYSLQMLYSWWWQQNSFRNLSAKLLNLIYLTEASFCS